jgi:hypothetical protein
MTSPAATPVTFCSSARNPAPSRARIVSVPVTSVPFSTRETCSSEPSSRSVCESIVALISTFCARPRRCRAPPAPRNTGMLRPRTAPGLTIDEGCTACGKLLATVEKYAKRTSSPVAGATAKVMTAGEALPPVTV